MTTITRLATGLLQPKRRTNGMADGRDAILAVEPSADVLIHKWSEWRDIPDIVRKIKAAWTDDMRIVLAGHSLGVWYCCEFAEELSPLPVDCLLSADGVNRPLSRPLFVPANVRRLYAWWQLQGVIKGSEFLVTPVTDVVVSEQVHVGHARVDETPAFHAALLAFATGGEA